MKKFIKLCLSTIIFFTHLYSVLSNSMRDRGLSFSDDGNIFQVSYAQKSIERSPAVIGFVKNNIGMIISKVEVINKFAIHNSDVNYNFLKYENLALCFTGMPGDVKFLLSYANKLIHQHKYKYGETINQVDLIVALSKFVTSALHYGYFYFL